MYAFVISEWAGIAEGEGCYTHMTPYASPVLVWDQPEAAHVSVDNEHKSLLGVAHMASLIPASTPPCCQRLHCTE